MKRTSGPDLMEGACGFVRQGYKVDAHSSATEKSRDGIELEFIVPRRGMKLR